MSHRVSPRRDRVSIVVRSAHLLSFAFLQGSTAMEELNPLFTKLKDLTARSATLRGYL